MDDWIRNHTHRETVSGVMQKLREMVTFAKGLVRFVKDPADVGSLRDMQVSLEQLASPADMERALQVFRSAEGFSELLAHRYQAPPWEREHLGHFSEGTLGHAVYQFMMENNLVRESLNIPQNESDIGYLRRRGQETHDIWHTVVGYGTDILGELGLHSFLMGNFFRCIKSERAGSSAFIVVIEVGLLAHIFIYRPRLIPQSLTGAVEGLRRGWTASPMWAVRWEEMWSRPLAEVRAQHLGSAHRA